MLEHSFAMTPYKLIQLGSSVLISADGKFQIETGRAIQAVWGSLIILKATYSTQEQLTIEPLISIRRPSNQLTNSNTMSDIFCVSGITVYTFFIRSTFLNYFAPTTQMKQKKVNRVDGGRNIWNKPGNKAQEKEEVTQALRGQQDAETSDIV